MIKPAPESDRHHHHTLRQDLVRTVLLWSGYFFTVLALAFFLSLNSLVDYMLKEMAQDRLSYQTKEFAKLLDEGDRTSIVTLSEALVKNPIIAGVLIFNSTDHMIHASVSDTKASGLIIASNVGVSSMRNQLAGFDHLRLFEAAMPGHSLALVMDRRPVLYAVYTATLWSVLLLFTLLGLSILALHYALKRYLLTPVHDVKQIMNHEISDEERAKLLSHLPDEAVELADTYDQAYDALRILSLAVEQASDAMMITDKDGLIEYYNAAACRFSGYGRHQAIGKTAYFARPANRETQPFLELWECLDRGDVWRGSVSERRKDGSTYPALTSLSPLRNEAGEITHYMCMHQDITAQQLLEERIRESQKMEALGTLVGGIAHDFNNILAGMTGNLYLAKRKVEDRPDVQKKITNVEKLSFRAADMINQLLTFARKNTVQMRPISLALVIKESLRLARVSIPENITLHDDICSEDLRVNGDAAQLQQVLLNLLGNSRDAVGDVAEPTIVVKLCQFAPDVEFLQAYPKSSEHVFARLTVEDNGSGISKTYLDNIFTPFFTTKGVGKGTGLGLAMVHGAVQSHEGIVQVGRKDSGGTVFSIYLPLLENEKSFLFDSLAPDKLPRGQGETILFADDDEQVRIVGQGVLESLNYRVLLASDGAEAIEIFIDNSDVIDLLILDVVMPNMGAEEVAQKARKINPEIPIIFATGYDKELVFNMSRETPNSVVFTKPFSVQRLGSHINHLLSSQRS